MKLTREQLVRGSVLIALTLIASVWLGRLSHRTPTATAALSQEQPQSWVHLGTNPAVSLDGETFRVTGPYKHENLAVYLLHSTEQDPTEYITLEDGLRSGTVKVKEKDQEQVHELMIENTGEQPLFLQEGDRIQGGKQDRIIYASHVVPPHSGKMPVSSFCVEHNRWTAGVGGKNFGGNANPVLAPLAVRGAAKVHHNQGQVWAAVASQKAVAQQRGLAGNTNSSLNETLDAPKVKKLSDEFIAALKDVLAKQADAKGLAIAVNGRILEINEYPNHQVLSKLYPRLLGSYALEAVLNKEAGTEPRTPRAADVCAYMWDNDQQAKQVALAAAQPARAGNQRYNPFQRYEVVAGFMMNNEEVATNYNIDNVVMQQRAVQQVDPLSNQVRAARLGNNVRVNPGRSQVQEAIQHRVSVNKDNQLNIGQSDKAYLCTTNYHGKVVHRQFLPRDAAQPAQAAPQQGQRQNWVPQQRANPANRPAVTPKN